MPRVRPESHPIEVSLSGPGSTRPETGLSFLVLFGKEKKMSIAAQMLPEFEMECANTRKYLERVPEEEFDWKPHEKSMSLGALASHLAENPGWAPYVLDQEELTLDLESYVPFAARTRKELLEVFDKNVKAALKALSGKSDDAMKASWRMKSGDQVVMEMPRMSVMRSVILNHTIHHRGQLSVYLRLKDVPLPAMYGPSADEQG